MKSITQKAKYKQSVIKYSLKYGVSKASRKFNEHRKTIYRWRERYDGTLKSLEDKSRKPHYHPKQHTQEEMDFWDVRKNLSHETSKTFGKKNSIKCRKNLVEKNWFP